MSVPTAVIFEVISRAGRKPLSRFVRNVQNALTPSESVPGTGGTWATSSGENGTAPNSHMHASGKGVLL